MTSLNKPRWKSWSTFIISGQLPVKKWWFPVIIGRKTYQERYHQRVKQSFQPIQTIFLVQNSHLVFLCYPDSNFHNRFQLWTKTGIQGLLFVISKANLCVMCCISNNLLLLKSNNPWWYKDTLYAIVKHWKFENIRCVG